MRRALALVLLLACGTDVPGDGSGSTSAATTTTTPTSGTGALTSASTSAETGASTTTGADDSISFLDSADYPHEPWCDPWSQDCPEGEKCTWYDSGSTGGAWNGTKCVSVMENPAQLDEPCVADGATSGIDTCDKGMMCWHVDDEGQGYCIGLCHGTSEAPLCDQPTAACAMFNDFAVCLAKCDPLTPDCDPSDLCIGSSSTDAFVCVLDASGDEGQQHDTCTFANACDPGLFCTAATDAAECDQSVLGCCQPFCDLNDPDADAKCGGVGQVCTPYLADGMAVPGYEHVGHCAVPE